MNLCNYCCFTDGQKNRIIRKYAHVSVCSPVEITETSARLNFLFSPDRYEEELTWFHMLCSTSHLVRTMLHMLVSTRWCVRSFFFFYFSKKQKLKKIVARENILGGRTPIFTFSLWKNGRIIRVCSTITQIFTLQSTSYNIKTEKIHQYCPSQILKFKNTAV